MVEMVKVSKLRVLKIEGEIVTAEVKFRWRAVDYTFVEKIRHGHCHPRAHRPHLPRPQLRVRTQPPPASSCRIC